MFFQWPGWDWEVRRLSSSARVARTWGRPGAVCCNNWPGSNCHWRTHAPQPVWGWLCSWICGASCSPSGLERPSDCPIVCVWSSLSGRSVHAERCHVREAGLRGAICAGQAWPTLWGNSGGDGWRLLPASPCSEWGRRRAILFWDTPVASSVSCFTLLHAQYCL